MVRDTVFPAKEKKEYALFTKNQWRFLEWARESATQDYQGRSVQQDGYWSKRPQIQVGPYLRGLADDVMLHHYGASDICPSFGDGVCVMAPSNRRLHLQTTVPAPCIKTAPLMSVTKALGLSTRIATLRVHKGYRAVP